MKSSSRYLLPIILAGLISAMAPSYAQIAASNPEEFVANLLQRDAALLLPEDRIALDEISRQLREAAGEFKAARDPVLMCYGTRGLSAQEFLIVPVVHGICGVVQDIDAELLAGSADLLAGINRNRARWGTRSRLGLVGRLVRPQEMCFSQTFAFTAPSDEEKVEMR